MSSIGFAHRDRDYTVTGPTCHRDHDIHATKTIAMPWGPFLIYDWEQYFDQEEWCPGQDDVSRTLDMYGTWEAYDIERFLTCVEPGATVLDFGAHIGWYAIQAGLAGCEVHAFEWQSARRAMLSANAWAAGVTVDIHPEIPETVDAEFPIVLKSDVEGAEDRVLAATRHLFADHKVTAAVLEVSPVFADYYQDLMDEIRGYGYRADVQGSEVTRCDFDQANVWFTL